jgi:hypothetical protein
MLDDETSVLIAVPPKAGSSPVGAGDVVKKAEKTLRESLKSITAAAEEAMDTFRAMTRAPEEVEITFGVTFDAKLGAFMASADAGAQLEVKLHWHRSAATASADEGKAE